MDLESILDADYEDHSTLWHEVLMVMQEREMPPDDVEDVKIPSDEDYASIINYLMAQKRDVRDTEPTQTTETFSVASLVQNHCANCHNGEERKGELDLDAISGDAITDHSAIWEKVITRLVSRQMPPPKRQRPDETTYEIAVSSLVKQLDDHALAHPAPGREATFRRLNRTEYQNAIRDLLGIHIDAATLLPKDDESHGFDNVTVGTLSPALVDRYISAAQKISRLAVGRVSSKIGADTFRVPPDFTQEKHIEGLPLGTRGGALIDYTFPQDGEYEVEVLLSRDRNEHVEGLNGSHQMEILIDRELIESFNVARKRGQRHSDIDKHLKTRTFVKAGPRKLGVTFVQKSYSLLENKRQPFEAHFNLHRHPRRSPAIYQVSITGPYNAKGAHNTPSRKKIFVERPSDSDDQESVAQEILAKLMQRAYRRPVLEPDMVKPMMFYREGAEAGGFEEGIESALKSILVHPEFLFRIEKEPADTKPGSVYRVSDLDLASRLSFFIWSSIPDEELLELAIAEELHQPHVLREQVRRMLEDPRSTSLVTNFAGQWLHLRNLEAITPDLRLFPDFDDNLRKAFRKETELFVHSVISEDRSVLELIKADYTFLNERLAHHYDIPGVLGSRFRRVILGPDDHRGGLLRQGSILSVTSYATRTSPVIRGNWILENILGTPPPPPPPNVPTLEENKVDATLSMREQLAEHRANPACASCHNLMDPVGFALENFDAVGRWRFFEDGATIDVSGGLPDGSEFAGIDKLEEGLLQRPELFVRTLSQKLLTFALGRGVEAHDAPAVRQIVRNARENDYRFSAIIQGIASSVPFQMRVKANTEVTKN